MKAVIQKVSRAQVSIEGKVVGKISEGLVILLGVTHEDSEEEVDYLIKKIVQLRTFPSEKKYFDQSISDLKLPVLVVSQFTLYAEMKKGRRPDFSRAAKPEVALPLYKLFVQKLKDFGLQVETGEFGANMQVELVNDGPVTLILESSVRK